VRIKISGYQTLECLIATLPTGRHVHVGETFNRFAGFGLRIAQKCVLRPIVTDVAWSVFYVCLLVMH